MEGETCLILTCKISLGLVQCETSSVMEKTSGYCRSVNTYHRIKQRALLKNIERDQGLKN